MAEINNTSSGQWSETDSSNTSVSPDGWPSGTYPNQVEAIGRATMGAIKRFWDRINGTVTTTGSSGTYTYTPSNSSFPTAYVSGEIFTFKADKDSAGSDVININSLGNKTLKKITPSGKANLAAGDIKSGQFVQCLYDGTDVIVLNPVQSLAYLTDVVAPTSWTPTDQSGASLSITNNASIYYKIGKLVVASFNITYPATANGSSAAISLPAVPNTSAGNPFGVFPLYISGANINNSTSINTGSGVLNFRGNSNAALLTNANLTADTMAGTIVYFTN